MAKFEWIGKAKRVGPPDDGLYEIVANLPPIGRTTYAEAQKVGAKAEAILAAHRAEGHSSIRVERGHKRVDAFVYLDDSRGDQAAAAIEFGTSRSQAVAPLRKAAYG